MSGYGRAEQQPPVCVEEEEEEGLQVRNGSTCVEVRTRSR